MSNTEFNRNDYEIFLHALSDKKTMRFVHEVIDVLGGHGLTVREADIILNVAKSHVRNIATLPLDSCLVIKQRLLKAQAENSEQT